MTIIRDYLKHVRSRLQHLGLRQREQVLSEIQDHLELEVARLRREDSSLSADEAALKATNAFGDPGEIGVAYGAGGGVVNQTTGERLLDVAVLSGQAAGRGVRGVFKWTGITAASIVGVLLVLAVASLVLAEQLADTFQEDIRDAYALELEAIPHPLYFYEDVWSSDAHTDVRSDTFGVRADIKEFHFEILLEPAGDVSDAGCVKVRLLDPNGEAAYDSGNACNGDHRVFRLHEPGTWTVEYTFLAYAGQVQVEASYYEWADRDGRPDPRG